MTGIIISIISSIASYLVEPTINEARYWFCANKIVEDFKTQKEKLSETQKSVQKRVKEARSKAHEIEDAVQKWLKDVEDLITKAEKLCQELEGIDGCFGGNCPIQKRYHLCKQLAEKTMTMIELNKTSEFNPFSHPTPISDIEYFSSGDFKCFESTKLAFVETLEALQDDNCCIIGLHGMGGSRKTTVVKELGKKAKDLKLFDQVAFTTISQTPNVRKIQGEIADLLGVKLEEETETGRARRIALKLGSTERILVILDDIWKKLNLEEIGIPSDCRGNSCKVLLTTCDQRTCTLMKCQKIWLDLLIEDVV